jgi:4-hydroxy-tetrahydrodipicolinate synthase
VGAITGIGVVMPREVLTLYNLCRSAASGDVEARQKALELEAAFYVLSSYDEGPDLVLYFKYMLLLKGEKDYALNFIETDELSASQRGYVKAQYALFNKWFTEWSKQGGAVARCLA